MGFFSKIFGGSEIEEQLQQTYVPMLMQTGQSISEAREWFENAIREAKEESRNEGMDNLPPNFGDYLLENEATNEKIAAAVAKSRRDGATDNDIRQWGNLHDLERRIMVKHDDLIKMAVMIDQLKKYELAEGTIDKEEAFDNAAAHVRKSFPIYGDPDDTSLTGADDRPLPAELKFRINIYVQRRSADPSFQTEIENSTTFNALIRREIANGNL